MLHTAVSMVTTLAVSATRSATCARLHEYGHEMHQQPCAVNKGVCCFSLQASRQLARLLASRLGATSSSLVAQQSTTSSSSISCSRSHKLFYGSQTHYTARWYSVSAARAQGECLRCADLPVCAGSCAAVAAGRCAGTLTYCCRSRLAPHTCIRTACSQLTLASAALRFM